VTPQLEATLAGLPTRPGVYLMRDARGTVLYVGKAQNLRSRVRSYWQKQSPGGGPGEVHRIREALDRVADLEYTLTDSVSEALLLEANLIKRFQPRFNVRLATRVTPTSGSPWARTSRGSSERGSWWATGAATSARMPRPAASTRR
jgi:excinuclease UvrABC nuclease subunit